MACTAFTRQKSLVRTQERPLTEVPGEARALDISVDKPHDHELCIPRLPISSRISYAMSGIAPEAPRYLFIE
jgi:hypothetical protein